MNQNPSMNWLKLKASLVAAYHPALIAERVVALALRRRVHTVLGWLTALSGLGALVLAPWLDAGLNVGAIASNWDVRLLGAFFLFLTLWIVSACFRALHYYYADERFLLARVLYRSSPADPVGDFARSQFGRLALARIGATTASITEFLKNRPAIVPARNLSLPENAGLAVGVDMLAYVHELLRADAWFAHFVASFGLTAAAFEDVVGWALEDTLRELTAECWWRRERLGRVRGIGKTWSYGRLYELEKFERPLPPAPVAFYGDKELQALEAILCRSGQANAFLIGDNMEEKMNILGKLSELIAEGKVMPELEHKRLVALDADLLISAAKSMSDFERLLRMLASEAAAAGNVVLVFLDFPAFVAAGQHYGLDVAVVLDPFFTATELQIVALTAASAYHALLEGNPALASRFGTVILESTGTAGTLRALRQEAVAAEQHAPVFFTYQALQMLAEGGDRYIVAGLQPEKSLSLLHEIVPRLAATASHGRRMVHRQDVEDFLRTKTGIPMGTIDEGERARLLNLGTILHQRIIGQDEAINAISAAVRRARSGVNTPDRPLGSFLFLGPTGVGKTETTKALADVFFGHDAAQERLDMSEYSSDDALEKLIGAVGGAPGILADMVREHPYGVLLLDEFEKTTQKVMNLFLQILDEGFFSDGQGAKVNCRNLLIIATSNAGAEMIWDAVKQGKDPSHSRELIVDALVQQSIFRPELLNRFDGVIIFHPLAREQLEQVARLQLEKLAKRLDERGVHLVITDELIHFVARSGTDPKFGARPMARAIQDTVEQAVADKIIAGNLAPGAEVVLTAADLT